MEKWFKVAESGQTIDGRHLDPKILVAAAQAYDLNIYTARINANHIMAMGVSSDNPFPALGSVLAFKAKEQDGTVSLYAQLDPTDQLVDLVNKRRQKLFTSIEMIKHLDKTDSPYLVGLAVTDQPASVGTEMLKFCRMDENFATAHKLDEREYLAALEATFDFSDQSEGFLERLKSAIGEKFSKQDSHFAAVEQGFATIAEICAERIAEMEQALGEDKKETSARIGKLTASLDEVKQQIERMTAQPATPLRPEATGEAHLPNC